ncbi:acyltransferase family protein [Phenylobacterium montanum]|uniref:Acyltransferase n=1 Tax=Phenylobacterium montanum TaxID=2823693 RepID=A0A975FZZ0_9CAUL|nr:acyltransferase [Caulobacter sp. S6]QUD88059.1 acyltransferase [Caulobacter sp. S6]
MKFSAVIQYLRAVAAIMVLCYHVVLHWIPEQKPHYLFLSGGVDIFFVISGFVMWSLTAGREGGAWDFFSRRLKRIVPLYWLMTTAMLVVLVVLPGATLTSKFDLGHVVSSYLFIPAIHPVKGTFEPLLFPGWTLNYEMFFYVLITLALLGPMRFRLALILIPLAGLTAMGLIPHSDRSLVAFYSNSLLAEFGMGCVLGALLEKDLAERAPPWAGVAMIGLAIAAFFGLAQVPGLARGFAWGVPAALFVSGWVFNERARGTARWPLVQLLGDASYAIYLSHVIVLSALFQIAHRFVRSVPAEIGASVVITLTCITVGVGVYWFVEKPIINWFKTPRLKPAVAAAE